MRWGRSYDRRHGRRHVHSKRSDDLKVLAGLLMFVLTILIVVLPRPLGLA